MPEIPEPLASFTLPPEHILLLLAVAWIALLYVVVRMEPKRFYIVRHGRTLLNEQGIKQGPDGALSPAGEAQAEKIGQYLSHFPIRVIHTSPYERAVQTAEIMRKHTRRARIKQTPLLAERKNPTEVIGKSVADPAVQEIVARTERGFHEDSYRYSDEENFEDLMRRAGKCLSYLERSRGCRTAVVTHHAFLQALLSYLLHRDELRASDYVKLAFFNPADNGGLTICEYHPWRRNSPTRGWEIVAYNVPV
jgi:broad specificity phosphatase PhoE